MSFQEYPKALYKGGEYVAVGDAAEEGSYRKKGFTDWHADQLRMNPVEDAPEPIVDEEELLPEIPAAVVVSAANAPKTDRAPLTLKK